MNKIYLLILFLTGFSVYSLKALRFYFLVAGEGIPFSKYTAIFSLTTFVNIAVPYKIGELFRFFAFGHLMKNYLKGFSVVLLDRFVDISSLLLIFVIIKLFGRTEFGKIFFFLLSVSIFLILFYLALGGILSYWSEYFIESRSSKRHLNALYFIEKLRGIYEEMKTLVHGRFFVIFTLSFFSWCIEIGALFLCRRFFDSNSNSLVTDYISAALSGANFLPLANFISASEIFLFFVFLFSILFVIFNFCMEKIKNGK